MHDYEVVVQEITQVTYRVQATSEDEAKDKVRLYLSPVLDEAGRQEVKEALNIIKQLESANLIEIKSVKLCTSREK